MTRTEVASNRCTTNLALVIYGVDEAVWIALNSWKLVDARLFPEHRLKGQDLRGVARRIGPSRLGLPDHLTSIINIARNPIIAAQRWLL